MGFWSPPGSVRRIAHKRHLSRARRWASEKRSVNLEKHRGKTVGFLGSNRGNVWEIYIPKVGDEFKFDR